VRVLANNIGKKFNRRTIFTALTFEAVPGEVLGIVGKNGSGKSTLLRIIGGILSPSTGSMQYMLKGRSVHRDELYSMVGYVAPYLTLYEEFSAMENLQLYARIRGMRLSRDDARESLSRIGLPSDRRDPIRAYSSGMKQRMKLLFAVMHRPPLLLLDEPVSNLDSDGVEAAYGIVDEFRRQSTVIIATNDAGDIAHCDRIISVEA